MNIEWWFERMTRWINGWGVGSELLERIWVIVAEQTVWWLAGLLVVMWVMNTRRFEALLGTWAFVLAFGIGKGVGYLFSHTQPFDRLEGIHQLIPKEVGNAFPSDHTLLVFAYAGVWYLLRCPNRWKWVMVASVISLSRVVVGVHALEDIVAGALIGLCAAFIVTKVPFVRAYAILQLYRFERAERWIFSCSKGKKTKK